jgi:hypothetical protein
MKSKVNLLIITSIILVMFNSDINAQYKKASFLERSGRFYQVGTGARIFGNGVSASPTLTLGWGKDKTGKRVFHWWNFEFIAPSKYKFSKSITPSSGTGVATYNINGKTSSALMFQYNWAFYILNNQLTENKFLPFIKLGVDLSVKSRRADVNEITTQSSNWTGGSIYTQTDVGGGYDAGLGFIFKISEQKALNFTTGYRYVANDDNNVVYKPFNVTPTHPYVNISFRYIMKGDD